MQKAPKRWRGRNPSLTGDVGRVLVGTAGRDVGAGASTRVTIAHQGQTQVSSDLGDARAAAIIRRVAPLRTGAFADPSLSSGQPLKVGAFKSGHAGHHFFLDKSIKRMYENLPS